MCPRKEGKACRTVMERRPAEKTKRFRSSREVAERRPFPAEGRCATTCGAATENGELAALRDQELSQAWRGKLPEHHRTADVISRYLPLVSHDGAMWGRIVRIQFVGGVNVCFSPSGFWQPATRDFVTVQYRPAAFFRQLSAAGACSGLLHAVH